MSALPPKTDIAERDGNVRFVPKAAVSRRSKNSLSKPAYSITSSAAAGQVAEHGGAIPLGYRYNIQSVFKSPVWAAHLAGG
jgi:hypothetical protein